MPDARIINHLACPHCGMSLHFRNGSLSCESLHSFDVARQGYVNLLSGHAKPGTADTAAMVSARARFLESGSFLPIAEAAVAAACEHLDSSTPGAIVDIGAGTGWLLAHLLNELPDLDGIALDISKYAARRAASAHPRALSAVCDAWGALPVQSHAAALVVSFFAPRNPAEFHRILTPNGLLLLITPRPDHLSQLVVPLGLITVDPQKVDRIEKAFSGLFASLSERAITTTMRLSRDQVADIASMGPSAHHAEPETLVRAVAHLPDSVDVTASVDIRVMRRQS